MFNKGLLIAKCPFQDMAMPIKTAIPCSHQNNYNSCSDAKWESLYTVFLQSLQGDNSSLVATALLA